MRSLKRQPVNKGKSVRSFAKGSARTHPRNMGVMRGGYRL